MQHSSRTIAEPEALRAGLRASLRGHVPPATSVRGAGVSPTKGLSEKPLCRSLSSIHVLYNQAIVGEMGPLLASARWIGNVQLPGGSIQ